MNNKAKAYQRVFSRYTHLRESGTTSLKDFFPGKAAKKIAKCLVI